VAAADERGIIAEALRGRGVDVHAESRRGGLAILDASAAYLVHGSFEPERTMKVFNDAIEQALGDGFTGLRAAADMTWALSVPDAAEHLIVYEALLRTLFATCRGTGLCLYDRSRMPLSILNGALVTHPLTTIEGEIQVNPFYDPTVKNLRDVPQDQL
jgi:hypothetical protein